MPVQCASNALRVSETVAAVCSFSFNLLLVLVIFKCKTKELRVYSRLILCNCAVDSVFAIASFVVEPVGLPHRCGVNNVLSMPIYATASS